jgi:hypothetical protein
MECIEALKTRRSVRAYTGEPVSREVIEDGSLDAPAQYELVHALLHRDLGPGGPRRPTAELIDGQGDPLISGEWLGARAKPPVPFYGHRDGLSDRWTKLFELNSPHAAEVPDVRGSERIPVLQRGSGDQCVRNLQPVAERIILDWTKPLRGIRVGPPFQPKDPALSNLAPAFL